ncbi:MAG: hypothetical protein OXE46_07755 [Chloroflexi bacterium]|nr:hypothetical protein [Chloroflexota bacterium]
MSEEPGRQELHSVEFEAYAGIVPHDSIIKGYQEAIPDGGIEVINIVKRQQLFTFIYNMTSLVTSNIIPLLLVLPILFAISAGAIIEISLISSIPIGVFTAGAAISRVRTVWRASDASAPAIKSGETGQRHLPADTEQMQP